MSSSKRFPGDRSYLAHDGNVAVVIDPQRDIGRVIAAAEREGVRITHVAETHIHNVYVSGRRSEPEGAGCRPARQGRVLGRFVPGTFSFPLDGSFAAMLAARG